MTHKNTTAKRNAAPLKAKTTRGASKDAAAKKAPAGISIKVRPEDKKELEELAEKVGVPLGVAANAALCAGCFLIRHEDVARRLARSSGNFLWRCINREQEDYTELMPLFADDNGSLDSAEDDAKQIGRTIEDWCGSLVEIGLIALGHPVTINAIIGLRSPDYFIRSCGYLVARKGGAA